MSAFDELRRAFRADGKLCQDFAESDPLQEAWLKLRDEIDSSPEKFQSADDLAAYLSRTVYNLFRQAGRNERAERNACRKAAECEAVNGHESAIADPSDPAARFLTREQAAEEQSAHAELLFISREHVQPCLERLDDREKQVLIAIYAEERARDDVRDEVLAKVCEDGLSAKQLKALRKQRAGHFRVIHHRAKHKLRKCLADRGVRLEVVDEIFGRLGIRFKKRHAEGD